MWGKCSYSVLYVYNMDCGKNEDYEKNISHYHLHKDDNGKHSDDNGEHSNDALECKDENCRNKDDNNVDNDDDFTDDNVDKDSSSSTVDYEPASVHRPNVSNKKSTRPKDWHPKKVKTFMKHATPKSAVRSSRVDQSVILDNLWSSCRQVIELEECSLFIQLKQYGKISYGGSADMIAQFKSGGITHVKSSKEIILEPMHNSKSIYHQEQGRTNPLRCHICSIGRKTFSSQSTLNRHLRRVHSINTKNSKDAKIVSNLESIKKEEKNVVEIAKFENSYQETESDNNEPIRNSNHNEAPETSRKPRKLKQPLRVCLDEEYDTNQINNQISDNKIQYNMIKHECEDLTHTRVPVTKTEVLKPQSVSQKLQGGNSDFATKLQSENPDLEIQMTPSTVKGKKEKCHNINSDERSKKKSKVKGSMCEECGYIARCNSHLKRHQRIHRGENPYKTGKTYQCDLCDFVADRPATVRRHSSTHTNERPFQCMTCGSTFRLPYHLKRHELTHLDPDIKLECKICNKKFTRKEHLVRHESVHSSERPFACSVCPKKFARSDYLKDHMRYHNGDRPHQCSHCGKRYVTKKECRKHEEKCCQNGDPVSFVTCRECKRTFRSIAALQRHEEKHREDHNHGTQRPFNNINNTQGVLSYQNACTISNEQFSDIDQLRMHTKQHIGSNPAGITETVSIVSNCTSPQTVEEPSPLFDTMGTLGILKCAVCDSMFRDNVSLSRHMDSHDLHASQAKDMCNVHIKQDTIAPQTLYSLY